MGSGLFLCWGYGFVIIQIDRKRGNTMKVFLCEHIHKDALQLLQTKAEIVDDWARIGEVDAIVNRNLHLDRELLSKAHNLKVVAIHGTGSDGVDLEYCRENGIAAFNVPYENSHSVAELIVALSLILLRKLHLADRLVCGGQPITTAPAVLMGSELAGKTLGLVGVGDIARRAARMMQSGFGVKVIGCSPSLTAEKAEELGIGFCPTMQQVLQQADIVNVGVHLTPETQNLIGERELACMKPTAILINTARGGVVDAEALYKALTSGQIAAAACDVFVQEPPTKENPLVGLENFVATPHIGANTDEALRRVGVKMVEEIFAVMDGQQPTYPCR